MAGQSNRATWWAELTQRAQQLGRGEDHILPLADVPSEGEEAEGGEPSLEALRTIPVIICPRPVKLHYSRIVRELGQVGMLGGALQSSAGGIVRMLGTDDSLDGQAIITCHLKSVDRSIKAKDWPEAYTRAAAVLRAATAEDFWFMDTEAPEDVVKIIRKMEKQWAALWACSEEELGGATAADRAVVHAAFNDLKDDVDEYCLCGYEYD